MLGAQTQAGHAKRENGTNAWTTCNARTRAATTRGKRTRQTRWANANGECMRRGCGVIAPARTANKRR
eukprot:11201527-Lingulodinium_polyedra.AAC.1